MNVKGSVALVVLIAATAACSDSGSGSSDVAPTSTGVHRVIPPATHEPVPVAISDWRAVIDDWFDDGSFSDPHSCAAVRTAMERLPSSLPKYASVYEDMRRYSQMVC